MNRKRVDFVKWLESQLKAFRARRFEKLDVEALGCELESVVGKYRSEVRRRAERLILDLDEIVLCRWRLERSAL
jgi:hypothetical protein